MPNQSPESPTIQPTAAPNPLKKRYLRSRRRIVCQLGFQIGWQQRLDGPRIEEGEQNDNHQHRRSAAFSAALYHEADENNGANERRAITTSGLCWLPARSRTTRCRCDQRRCYIHGAIFAAIGISTIVRTGAFFVCRSSSLPFPEYFTQPQRENNRQNAEEE